jgi:hypothetical protein
MPIGRRSPKVESKSMSAYGRDSGSIRTRGASGPVQFAAISLTTSAVSPTVPSSGNTVNRW